MKQLLLIPALILTVSACNNKGGDKKAELEELKKQQAELQSKIAVATGGFLGKGPGNSTQRAYLPHPYSDFIYAIIIEEYGLIGGALIIFVYLLFLFRCIRLFRRCPYAFGAFLASRY